MSVKVCQSIDPIAALLALAQEHDPSTGFYRKMDPYHAHVLLIAAKEQRSELIDALQELLVWADHLGGWESPCWDRARAIVERHTEASGP